MSMQRKTIVILFLVITVIAHMLYFLFFPDCALAKEGDYMNINGASILSTDGSGGTSPILSSGMSVLNDIVTFMLLPVAILVVASKCIYLAIFGMMIGKDPLGLVDKNGGRGTIDTHGKSDYWKMDNRGATNAIDQDTVKKQLIENAKNTGKMLAVILLLWVIFEIIILIVAVSLGIAPTLLS